MGDGVKMAQQIGADLWHMNSYAGASTCVRAMSADSIICDIPYPTGHDFIFVNGEGKRFMYEEMRSIVRHGKQKDKGIWPLLTVPSPSWMILGGNKSGSIDILGMVTYMDWPVIMGKGLKTNQELIDAGIMFKADTIEELAEKIGFPPETLAETVATYNQYCADGADPEFGRGEEVYGIEIALGILNSQGGARRNGLCEVLDTEGQPIPRLYSAGEFGSIYAYMYNGGGNISEAVATGRVAGQQAAGLDSWE